MPNLAEIVETQSMSTGRKVIRTCLTKADLRLSEISSQACHSKRFYLVKLPTRKVPLFSVDAAATSPMIVIDVNSKRKRATSSGFTPKIVVLKGLNSLEASKASEKLFTVAWVGDKALKKMRISAEDAIGANALQSKLQSLIVDKYRNQKSSKASDNTSYSPSPWIKEIYPFDNYFVFEYDGDVYKQIYALNEKTQEPTLTGEPAMVHVEYVPDAVSAASLADVLYGQTYLDRTMNQETTLDFMNVSSPALGSYASRPQIVPDGTFINPNSELGRPDLKTMLNVREALSIFLNMLKSGMDRPQQNSFAPVSGIPSGRMFANASREAEIASKEAHRKINVPKFIRWQHEELSQEGSHKKYGLAAGAYAYVGDPNDISTWHLRADSKKEIKNALRHVIHCEGIPEKRRETIKLKLQAMYKRA